MLHQFSEGIMQSKEKNGGRFQRLQEITQGSFAELM